MPKRLCGVQARCKSSVHTPVRLHKSSARMYCDAKVAKAKAKAKATAKAKAKAKAIYYVIIYVAI